jgi:hypothetical protein
MKKFLLLGCTGWFALAGFAAESFVQQLTPAERTAAGLDQLTPAQQAALDQLAARYATEGSRAEVAKVREETKAEVAKVREETKAVVEHEVKKREEAKFGLFGIKGHEESIKSKVTGTFNGWSGRTLFRLENGQQWVQSDPSDFYSVKNQPGPEIEIVQSGIGGWKLYLTSNGRWVRVKRVN